MDPRQQKEKTREFWDPRTKLAIPWGKYSSIFQAEVFAINLYAEIILRKIPINQHIAICSDSQVALKAISSRTIKSQMVWECVKKLKKLGERNKVRLLWVPGHTAIEGNKIADKLANQTASTPPTGPEPSHNKRGTRT